MRALLQRVRSAAVRIDGEVVGQIGPGLAILVGITQTDGEAEAVWLAEKCVNLRIFEDEAGKLNRSALDTAGELLVVSQFTLYGDCRYGRRPSFTAAAPEQSEPLYRFFVAKLRDSGLRVATGQFGADMLVEIHNDGPVTLWVESK